MDFSIRLAKNSDLKDYTDLLQSSYQAAYTDEKIGLTKDCFSKEIFNSSGSQDYFRSNLIVNKQQKTWLGFLNSKLIASLTIFNKDDECELRGFYVAPKYQGQGIGKQLWELALNFSDGRDIVLDLYSHNQKTIKIYKKWGFKIDKQKGIFYRHWPEWPKGLEVECLYMRLHNKVK